MLSAALPVVAHCPPPASYSPPIVVQSVTDGDTVRLASGQRVRIPGINAFELKDSGWRQSLANQAKRQAETLIKDTVVLSPWPARKDRYGRLLAHIWLGDQYLSESIVGAGLGIGCHCSTR
jgi:Micrococcal nuclease (thermonuclease) homologs